MDKPKAASPIKVLFEWESPERIWQPRSRVWFLAYAAIFSLTILIVARLGFFIIILGLIALLFLIFVQASVPPLLAKHKLTTQGIITRDTLFKWTQITSFWFSHKDGHVMLYLDFKPEEQISRITLLINPEDDKKIFNLAIDKTKYASEKEADVNFVSRVVYGEYVPMSEYLQDLDQPDLTDEHE